MSATLLQSYITNIRLTLQSLEYLRVSEVPKITDLDVYARIKNDGYLENFVSDTNSEFEQGEILILLNKEAPTLSTVYRNTKPRGSIVKHENVDVTAFWNFITLPENYSKAHVVESIKQVELEIENDFYKFDIESAAAELTISYTQAVGRAAEDNTDSNKLVLEKTLSLRDLLLMRTAYEMNNGKVQSIPVEAHRVQLSKDMILSLESCPWLNTEQFNDIIKSITRDGSSFVHPDLLNYTNFFIYVYVKSGNNSYIVTSNKIYDVTNVDKTLPRFFTYVK